MSYQLGNNEPPLSDWEPPFWKKVLLVIPLAFLLGILIAAQCDMVRKVRAEEPPETMLYIYDLNEPAVEMPVQMALGAGTVWLECEVKSLNQLPYANLAAAIGTAGERGQAQIHPSWEKNARTAIDFVRLGLDYSNEGDRIKFAVELWKRAGWSQWSCAARMGIQ